MRQPDERVLQKQAIGLFYLLIIHILAIILREDLFLAFFLRRPLVVHPIRTTPGTGMMPPRLPSGIIPTKEDLLDGPENGKAHQEKQQDKQEKYKEQKFEHIE